MARYVVRATGLSKPKYLRSMGNGMRGWVDSKKAATVFTDRAEAVDLAESAYRYAVEVIEVEPVRNLNQMWREVTA